MMNKSKDDARFQGGMLAICLIPFFIIGFAFIEGCEPPPSNRNQNGWISVNGRDYPIPDGSFSLTVQNGQVQIQPEQKPREQFLTKVIDVDFVARHHAMYPRTEALIRIITCEYENSKHYVLTHGPFKEVPCPNEEWLVHLGDNGEVVFDSLAQ